MKIAVMAGTPIDTNMGAVLLKKNGFSENEIIRIPVSENPVKQTIFQTSETEYKEKIINSHIDNIKNEDCNVLFVYCNSLSGAVDFEKLGKKNNIKIVTPMQIYREIASKYEKIAVFAANAQGLAGIENAMFKGNSEINITGMTFLEIVKEIEKGTLPEVIAEKFHFDKLTEYLKNLGNEAILLGCTHFPYIENEIRKRSDMEVINPSQEMLEKIK